MTGTAHALPFPDASFDVVLFMRALAQSSGGGADVPAHRFPLQDELQLVIHLDTA